MLVKLPELDLRGAKVLAQVIAALQKALPQCQILGDGGVIEPDKPGP